MSIKIEGMRDLKKVFDTIGGRRSRNLIRTTVHGVAGDVRDEIKSIAPDDPATRKGDIVRTTKIKREKTRNREQFESTVRIGAFYWKFVEDGTTKMSAQPFVLPTVEKIRPELPKIFLNQFGKKLEAMLAREYKRRKFS